LSSNYFSVHFVLALFFVSENLSLHEASGSLLNFNFFLFNSTAAQTEA